MLETYFDMWFADKQNMIATMNRNLQADLQCGYNPNGNCILNQRKAIIDYENDFLKQCEKFVDWSDKKIDRWCKLDMLKRGVIEI